MPDPSQSFGGGTVHFGPKAVWTWHAGALMMEGRKMRNPRYSDYMIKCSCAEKNT